MTYKTHMAFALAVTIPLTNFFNLSSSKSFLFLALVAIGALTPDLDEPNSYLSKRLFIFALLFKLFNVAHRGITHKAISVFFLILFFIGLAFLNQDDRTYLVLYFGFIAGYILHLIGDMLTKGGINQFFYPLSNKKAVLLPKRYRFYTGGKVEFLLFVFLGSVVALQTIYFFGVSSGLLNG